MKRARLFLKYMCVCVLACTILCASCRSKNYAEEQISPQKPGIIESLKKILPWSKRTQAEKFLDGVDTMLDEQDKQRELGELTKEEQEEKRLIQVTINQTIDELLALDPKKDKKFITGLIKDLHNFPKQSVEALETMLSENRPERQRILLITALSSFKSQKAEEALYAAASEAKSEEERNISLEGLKDAKHRDVLVRRASESFDASRKSSQSKANIDEQVRSAQLLGALGGDEAIYKLQDIINEAEDIRVKKKAINALGSVGGDLATSILFEVFDNDEAMRDAAATSLGKMKKEDIVLGFGEILWNDESSPALKVAAVKGLGADNGKVARSILLKVLRDTTQSREAHKQAIAMLLQGYKTMPKGEIDDLIYIFMTTPVEYLPQMLQPLLAKGGDEAVDRLADNLAKMNQLKKIHAVRTMGRVGNKRVFSALKKAIYQETDTSVRREMLSSIAKCKSDDLKQEVTDFFLSIAHSAPNKTEKLNALRQLESISPPDAVKIAEKFISTADEEFLNVSIDVLRKHGTHQSLGTLRQLQATEIASNYEKRIENAIAAIEARNK